MYALWRMLYTDAAFGLLMVVEGHYIRAFLLSSGTPSVTNI
uniref:Uncharacterized protein n=1 Tax=Arundo donax TaxID=35708 RepID=A0A0A9BEM3_ARUDO